MKLIIGTHLTTVKYILDFIFHEKQDVFRQTLKVDLVKGVFTLFNIWNIKIFKYIKKKKLKTLLKIITKHTLNYIVFIEEAISITIWLFQTYTTLLRELEKMNDIKVKLLILLTTLFVFGCSFCFLFLLKTFI